MKPTTLLTAALAISAAINVTSGVFIVTTSDALEQSLGLANRALALANDWRTLAHTWKAIAMQNESTATSCLESSQTILNAYNATKGTQNALR